MATEDIDKLPLIAIVGPTASGKTALAIRLAERFGGEIICADSRTIYKGMDIGTAKPTAMEQKRVPHWGLDVVEPGDRFTAADFKRYALQTIDEIRARGHIPFLVGGTGLYMDAVLFDYQFSAPGERKERERLERMTIEQLHIYCYKNDIKLPENKLNKRYVIRTIEQGNVNTKRRENPISSSIIVGIATDRNILKARIRDRAEQIFDDGVVHEATLLGKKYGWNNEAMTGSVYPLVHSHLEDGVSIEEIKEKMTTLDWRLAKRQLTWLRRNPYIHWGNATEVHDYVTQTLANA